MAYDKYRINPAYLNQFRGIAYNDPWFALGELIVRGYNKAYEDRGTRKAIEKIEAQYGTGEAPSQNDMSQALDVVQQRYNQGARDTLGLGGLSPTMDRDKVQAVKQSLGVQDTKGQAMFAMSPLNDPNKFQGDSEFNKRMRAEAQQKQAQMDALKTIGAVPMTNVEIGNRVLDQYAGRLEAQRDPQTGATTGVIKTPGVLDLAEQAYNKRMADFSAKDEMANIVLQMERDGRSPEQIARVKEAMEGKLQSMQDKYYAKRAGDIMGSLNGLSYDDPKYQQAIVELAKYDPAAAKVYAGNVVTGRDKWNLEQQIAKEDRATQRNIDNYRTETGLMIERDNAMLQNKIEQMKAAGYNDAQIKQALYGGGSGGGRRRGGGGSSSDGGKMPAHLNNLSNLMDQVETAIDQGDNDTAADLQDQIQTMIYSDSFRKKVSSDQFAKILQMWNKNEADRMAMLKEKGLSVNEQYYSDRLKEAGLI